MRQGLRLPTTTLPWLQDQSSLQALFRHRLGMPTGIAVAPVRSSIMSNTVEEVRADFVHFVDENHTWNFVTVSLTPNCFCLRLNTCVTVKNSNSTIENSQRTLNFDCEVNVTRCVDDVHAVLWSFWCCSRLRCAPRTLLSQQT